MFGCDLVGSVVRGQVARLVRYGSVLQGSAERADGAHLSPRMMRASAAATARHAALPRMLHLGPRSCQSDNLLAHLCQRRRQRSASTSASSRAMGPDWPALHTTV